MQTLVCHLEWTQAITTRRSCSRERTETKEDRMSTTSTQSSMVPSVMTKTWTWVKDPEGYRLTISWWATAKSESGTLHSTNRWVQLALPLPILTTFFLKRQRSRLETCSKSRESGWIDYIRRKKGTAPEKRSTSSKYLASQQTSNKSRRILTPRCTKHQASKRTTRSYARNYQTWLWKTLNWKSKMRNMNSFRGSNNLKLISWRTNYSSSMFSISSLNRNLPKSRWSMKIKWMN